MNNNNIIQRTFKNFDQALDIAKIEYNYEECGANISRSLYNDTRVGTKNFNEALNLAYNGWKEGLEIIHKNFSKYRDIFADLLPQQDVRVDQVFDTYGEDVNIDRFIQGEPENMLTFKPSSELIKITSGNKLQRLVIQSVASSDINPESIALNGSLLTILVEQYELHGFRTEIINRYTVQKSYGGKILNIDITIKNFDESPDFSKISFVLAHPSMLRRIILAIMEHEPLQTRKEFNIIKNGNYSYACDYKDDTLVDKNTLYIPQLTFNTNLETMIQHYRNLVCNHFSILSINEYKPAED